MNRGRPGGKVRAATLIAFALIASASCASRPKPAARPPDAAPSVAPSPAAPAAQASPADAPLPPPPSAVALPVSPAPAGSGSATGTGTALKTADPAALSRSREEREEIETSIVFGSPSSLARARDLASKAMAIKAEDAAVLGSLAQGIAALAYPEAPGSSQSASVGAPAGTSGTAQGLLGALRQAAAGQSPEVPADATGSPLGELIPALALFASDSSDSSRRAFDALERFARLGVPSIMPSILRGIDAERRGDWQGALELYRSVLAIAPDAWTATLGSGRALLAMKRSGEAIAMLSPLAQARSGLSAFDRPFALALYANGRYADADPYVSRVLTRNPQDSQFILIRARLLVRAKSYPQALPLLDAYGTVDPSDRLYLLLRCIESEALKAREEALSWARRGLAAYADDPELLAAASRLLFAGPAFGREEARTLALRVLQLVVPGAAAPADSDTETGAVLLAARQAAAVEASRLLAFDAASSFKWVAAAAYLARAGTAFKDKALAARILRKAGNAGAALDYASAWYRDQPRSEDAAEAYLRALVDTGDEKSAQEAIDRLLPGASSPPFRSVLYVIESKLQKSDEAALTLLHSALVENADNPEALAAVSDIQLRRKDYAKARFYLKLAIATNPGDPELEARQQQLDAVSPP
jgi:tetratricopeptide (TPR) repeat protein